MAPQAIFLNFLAFFSKILAENHIFGVFCCAFSLVFFKILRKMAKIKAKNKKLCQKKTKTAPKAPLRAKICGIRTNMSPSTKKRDSKRLAAPKEVQISNAIASLRKKFPYKKHFGRQKVYDELKGELSMGVISRMLSPKRGRVFKGRNKEYPKLVKKHWEIYGGMLGMNTASRISRKASYC